MSIKAGKLSLELIALGAAGAFFLFGAIQGGLIETLGFERDTKRFHTFVSTKSGGFGLGLKYFYLREGQVAFVDYDAEVRQGSLRLGLHKMGAPIGKGPHFVHQVAQSGSGRAEFAIPESGIYKFYFNGSVLGDDTSDSAVYDVSYEILWGVRGAPSGTATAAYPSDQG